jgi:hypothetical protein
MASELVYSWDRKIIITQVPPILPEKQVLPDFLVSLSFLAIPEKQVILVFLVLQALLVSFLQALSAVDEQGTTTRVELIVNNF